MENTERTSIVERIMREDRELKQSMCEWEEKWKKQRSIDRMGFFGKYLYLCFGHDIKQFFGENFDEIRVHVSSIEVKDVYDIVMFNSNAAGIIEVKYSASLDDIPQVLKKATTFRANFPKYSNHRIYLGLASMAFYPEVEVECKKAGIAIVKQVGETVVIDDEHLKVF